MKANKFRNWFPVAVWMISIFWMSTDVFSSTNTAHVFERVLRFFMPGISSHTLIVMNNVIRKMGHLTEYFILGILLFRFFRSGSPEPNAFKWKLYVLSIVLIFAATDEFHQSFVPSRTASLIDVGIDTAGGLLSQAAIAVWYLLARRRKEERMENPGVLDLKKAKRG